MTVPKHRVDFALHVNDGSVFVCNLEKLIENNLPLPAGYLYKELVKKFGKGIFTDISHKITLIKELRDFSRMSNRNKKPLGLADAKSAVENFDLFLKFVKDNDRFPLDGFGHSSGNVFLPK